MSYQKKINPVLILIVCWVAVGIITKVDALKCYSCQGVACDSSDATKIQECKEGEVCYESGKTRGCFPKAKAECIKKVKGSDCFTSGSGDDEKLTKCFEESGDATKPETMCTCSNDLCNNKEQGNGSPAPDHSGSIPGMQCYQCSSSKHPNCTSGKASALRSYNESCSTDMCTYTKSDDLTERSCATDPYTVAYGRCVLMDGGDGCIKNNQIASDKVGKCLLPLIMNHGVGQKMKLSGYFPNQKNKTGRVTVVHHPDSHKSLKVKHKRNSEEEEEEVKKVRAKHKERTVKEHKERITMTIEPDNAVICFCRSHLCNSATQKYGKLTWAWIGALITAFYHF